ncbi:hypothetical protein DV736_g3544, partial [Chaetothyriales sp. CBS 134916]
MAIFSATFSATKLQVATYLLGVCPFSIAFLVFLNSSVSFVVTDLIGLDKGVGDAVGSLGFADELLALIACPLWGLISDRIGVRYVCVSGYLIVGLALVVFVQAHNIYPQLLLGRLFFSLGGAAATTMVTAVLPVVSSSDNLLVNGDRSPAAATRSHAPSPSVASELTITPDRFRCMGSRFHDGSVSEPNSYVSTSRIAGLVGMFTGCGALIALVLFLPLPANFQNHGVKPDLALQYSFYIVATIAFILALWCWLGLRRLSYEVNLDQDRSKDTKFLDQVSVIGHNLRRALAAGFQRSDICLGYLGGAVARASSVGISLFIPLLVNALFLSSHLCQPESAFDSPAGLPGLKRKCPRAYIVAAQMTGLCETVALLAAPIFGYVSSKTSRKGFPMMVASACGIIGYALLPTQFSPDDKEKNKRAVAFLAVSLIGVSQIGAIVCSLGVLSNGILAQERTQLPSDAANASLDETEALLESRHDPTTVSSSLLQLKGAVAGIYSFYGGAAILVLTKLGGSLFDSVSFGAPFYLMSAFNALREWIESKTYYESDIQIRGWYGTKTKQDYLNEPTIFQERRARKKAERSEKERRRQHAAVDKLGTLPENEETTSSMEQQADRSGSVSEVGVGASADGTHTALNMASSPDPFLATERRLVRPGEKCRITRQDIVDAGFRRWDGRHRVTTDWLNVFNEPELQCPSGDVLVYLREPGQSSRGPALRIHSDKVRAKGFGTLLNRCVSLPSLPTLSSCILNNCSGCLAHAPAKELYIPAPQGYGLDATFDHHITTRNFFAWLYDLPLAGRTLGWSLRALTTRMDAYRPNSKDKNLADVIAFAETQRYLDFRECVDHALAALSFAEYLQIEDLWIDAFTHCVGLAHRSLRESMEYELVSERSKRLISDGRVDLEAKLDRVMRSISNFFEDNLTRDFRGLPQIAREHMDRFRSFLHSYYIEKYGFWPPPNFHQETVQKEIYQSIHTDFRKLYQHLADPKSALLGTDPDIAANTGVYTLQSIRQFDTKYHHRPLPLSLPMLPCADSVEIAPTPKLRKLHSWNPIAKRKMAREHRNARRVQALIDSSNRDWMIMNDSLVRRFSEFEAESALDILEPVSLEDGRKVRWIVIYSILQILASVIDTPQQVRNGDGLSYSLCCRTPDCLPWLSEAQSAFADEWASKQNIKPDVSFTHTNATKKTPDWSLTRRTTIALPRQSADRTSILRSVSRRSLQTMRSDPSPKLPKPVRRASFCEIYVPGYGNGLNHVRVTSSPVGFDQQSWSSRLATSSCATQAEEDEVIDHVPSLHHSGSASRESSACSIASSRSSLATQSIHDAIALAASAQVSLSEVGIKPGGNNAAAAMKSQVGLIDIVDEEMCMDTVHFNTLTWDNMLKV